MKDAMIITILQFRFSETSKNIELTTLFIRIRVRVPNPVSGPVRKRVRSGPETGPGSRALARVPGPGTRY